MSHYNQPAPEGKDPELWEIAQRRASFKKSFITYCVVNCFLWIIWAFTNIPNTVNNLNDLRTAYIPWPIWPTLGWGIGIAFQYAGAYIFPKINSVESEYQKLKNQQQTK